MAKKSKPARVARRLDAPVGRSFRNTDRHRRGTIIRIDGGVPVMQLVGGKLLYVPFNVLARDWIEEENSPNNAYPTASPHNKENE